MNALRNFMRGRYGADQLNLALILVSLFLSLLFRFIPVPYLYMITYVPFVYAIYRMLSRNVIKRGKENVKFLNMWYRVKKYFTGSSQHMKDRKVYKFTKCPNCTQKIRLPKGRGKICVTCPKCHAAFEKKT